MLCHLPYLFSSQLVVLIERQGQNSASTGKMGLSCETTLCTNLWKLECIFQSWRINEYISTGFVAFLIQKLTSKLLAFFKEVHKFYQGIISRKLDKPLVNRPNILTCVHPWAGFSLDFY